VINRILTVGGLTLVSRVTGFLRDIVMAAVLGAGPVADAFLVAFRLPNHFRAIFAEGAFAAAFVPAYARVRTQDGVEAAKLFGDRIFTLLLASQIVLLAIALAFTPSVIRLLAPGFSEEPERFGLAVALTRITFPYLALMTLVTLFSGILNSVGKFATAAAAPILLNFTMMFALLLAAFFPTAGHAAAWGVLIAGVLEVLLVGGAALRADVMTVLRRPKLDEDVKRFFKALGPATIGSAGVQLALFADTIIASFLAAGALSALYYADRLYQLPGGVIGIAVGTVLLPEMARRLAAGDTQGARAAQERAIEFTLLLAIPCVAAFLIVPDLIMHALFARGNSPSRCARGRAHACGLYDRADPVRSNAQRGRDLPRASGHRDDGQGRAHGGRGEHRAEGRAALHDRPGADRSRARDLGRRVGQFRPAALVRHARWVHRVRCSFPARRGKAHRRGYRARRGAMARANGRH
jgi:putative peptidoglycan lipid II flippase